MDNHSTDFSSYTLEDFIDHPGFIVWVSAPDTASDTFWQQVQQDHPQTEIRIADARRLVLSLRFQKTEMDLQEQQTLWATIKQQTQPVAIPANRIAIWMQASAAVLLIGLLSLSLFFYRQQQKIMVSTTFGQLKSVTLPDGTLVTLNANSTIHYPKQWDPNHIREVWIEGEAFFKVNHLHRSGPIKEGDHFTVHAENLNVEVLGTSFNVNNRRGLVKVALVTGRVGLEVEGKDDDLLKLKPGELGEYQRQQETMVKHEVQAQDYVAWKSGKLHFSNTPLTQVLQLIEDDYGYKAVLKDQAIGNKKLSGTFSVSSEDALLKGIATSLGIVMEKEQSTHQLIIK